MKTRNLMIIGVVVVVVAWLGFTAWRQTGLFTPPAPYVLPTAEAERVVVEKTVEVEKIVEKTVEVEKVVEKTVEVVITATPEPETVAPTPKPNVVSLRYDNAGCETNTGLAPNQEYTVAYLICHSKSPTEAWKKVQDEIRKVGASTYTADPGTEVTMALPLGVSWAIWNSTCPTDPLKVDMSRPSQDLVGDGCVRYMPAHGAGDRVVSFEQAVAVH